MLNLNWNIPGHACSLVIQTFRTMKSAISFEIIRMPQPISIIGKHFPLYKKTNSPPPNHIQNNKLRYPRHRFNAVCKHIYLFHIKSSFNTGFICSIKRGKTVSDWTSNLWRLQVNSLIADTVSNSGCPEQHKKSRGVTSLTTPCPRHDHSLVNAFCNTLPITN